MSTHAVMVSHTVMTATNVSIRVSACSTAGESFDDTRTGPCLKPLASAACKHLEYLAAAAVVHSVSLSLSLAHTVDTVCMHQFRRRMRGALATCKLQAALRHDSCRDAAGLLVQHCIQ